MITFKRFFSILLLVSITVFYSVQVFAEDLDQILSGDEVEDSLGAIKTGESSPYVIENPEKEIENTIISKDAQTAIIFNENHEEISDKVDVKAKFKDIGYTTPGTFEHNENYIETDKSAVVKDLRNHTQSSLTITFIKNGFNYASENDIINRTISDGPKHVKGGALYLHSDQYFFKSAVLNVYLNIGGGVGYNSGHGLFVTGDRSETTFRLWEIPLDLGLGVEIPIYHWFKIAGAAGPSVEALYQNRNDFQSGEKGRNKTQVSYGQYADLQFKINLTGFNSNYAYDLFAESKITNLSMNLEARYQNYQNFQDQIKISGTSFGIGFTFEYL